MEVPGLEQVGIKVESSFKLDEFRNMVITQAWNGIMLLLYWIR